MKMNPVDEAKNLGNQVVGRETEQGFTPGPWQVFKGDRCWHVASMDRTFETGCIMFVGGYGNGAANARLIAAAPALYEALTTLLKTETNLGGVSAITLLDAVDKARAALALVDGEQTK